MLPNELVQVRHMIDYSSNGQYKIFEIWTRLAKKVYDTKVRIQWRWQIT